MTKKNNYGDNIRFMPINQKKKAPDAIGDAILKTRGRGYRQEMVAVHFEKVHNVLTKQLNLCVQVYSRIKVGRVIQLSKPFFPADNINEMRKMAELLAGAAAEECNLRYAAFVRGPFFCEQDDRLAKPPIAAILPASAREQWEALQELLVPYAAGAMSCRAVMTKPPR